MLYQPKVLGMITCKVFRKKPINSPWRANTLNQATSAASNDLRYPTGFENVFNPHDRELDCDKAWLSVQGLVKVREFLAANPNQKAKLFPYTPSVGEGNPTDWYWVIYLKK